MLNPDQCWQAVIARDASPAPHFFFGVRTTGIYCRPGCASRLPRRENSLFFPSAAAAETAGFRPCKRCRPADPTADAHHVVAVEKACRIIETSDKAPALAELAAAVGISRVHFHRLFRQITGTTPRDFARTHRLARFAAELDGGEGVATATYAAGFGASSRAYEAAQTGLGMTPGTRRRKGRGETIRFATTTTTLGILLVAATARGICAVEFGDTPDALGADFRQRFAAANVAEDRGELLEWAERVAAYVDCPDHPPDLPLDIKGTAFQARVWRALQRIPAGETLSYARLAEHLGQPMAVRAVGSACARNPIGILVPCHRAVGSDGSLRGYRWGIERKRALLERERRTPVKPVT